MSRSRAVREKRANGWAYINKLPEPKDSTYWDKGGIFRGKDILMFRGPASSSWHHQPISSLIALGPPGCERATANSDPPLKWLASSAPSAFYGPVEVARRVTMTVSWRIIQLGFSTCFRETVEILRIHRLIVVNTVPMMVQPKSSRTCPAASRFIIPFVHKDIILNRFWFQKSGGIEILTAFSRSLGMPSPAEPG
ncbi:hypothetical protein K438DRAFT_1771256 [Mycena galopus ATCC 62051]|nr:hypothetical protein K438DRAFT_1771256 [Mycena galopus ATCC 62051]